MVASTVDDMTSIQQTRTVAQKMGVKPGLRAYLRDAPATPERVLMAIERLRQASKE